MLERRTDTLIELEDQYRVLVVQRYELEMQRDRTVYELAQTNDSILRVLVRMRSLPKVVSLDVIGGAIPAPGPGPENTADEYLSDVGRALTGVPWEGQEPDRTPIMTPDGPKIPGQGWNGQWKVQNMGVP